MGSRDVHRTGDDDTRKSSKDSSGRKPTDDSSKDNCIMCIKEKSEMSGRSARTSVSTNESSELTATDQSEAWKLSSRSSLVKGRKAGKLGPSEQRPANKRIVSDCLDNRDARVQRSKSDAQSKVTNEDFIRDNIKVKNNNSLSSKIIKRSMS